jgi:hypothetical protein
VSDRRGDDAAAVLLCAAPVTNTRNLLGTAKKRLFFV